MERVQGMNEKVWLAGIVVALSVLLVCSTAASSPRKGSFYRSPADQEDPSRARSPVIGDYAELVESLGGLEEVLVRITYAADWLVNVSQIPTESLPEGVLNSHGYKYSNWTGAFRNEYDAGSKKWDTYGPVWHGGQAIRGLLAASKVGERLAAHLREQNSAQPLAGFSADQWEQNAAVWLESAKLCGGFILDKQVKSGDREDGLILAYENDASHPQSSTMLEGMRGLYDLSMATGDQSYADAANRAVAWSVKNAWMSGEGLLYDLWDRQNQSFLKLSGWNYVTKDGVGRPLADDWVYLELYRQTNSTTARQAFYDVIDRLYSYERPAGNWVDFVPCNPKQSHGGWLHPRQAFWWGRPFLAAYNDTGMKNASLLAVAQRAGMWYANASRLDGGLIRETAVDLTTSTFGQVTSGVSCAALHWMDLHDIDRDPKWLSLSSTGLNWVKDQQFIPDRTTDPNLRGAVLELNNPPGGSDRSPYHIRDIATSFSLQAFAKAAGTYIGKYLR